MEGSEMSRETRSDGEKKMTAEARNMDAKMRQHWEEAKQITKGILERGTDDGYGLPCITLGLASVAILQWNYRQTGDWGWKKDKNPVSPTIRYLVLLNICDKLILSGYKRTGEDNAEDMLFREMIEARDTLAATK